MALIYVPGRGRIVIVNFDLAGSGVPPEMCKPGRPCVVIHGNSLNRGNLVTVVPISTKAPHRVMPYHHLMSPQSFHGWPDPNLQRWAKCDYVTTVALARCVDPYVKQQGTRKFIKSKATPADMEAIEKCILHSLGIDPKSHVPVAEP